MPIQKKLQIKVSFYTSAFYINNEDKIFIAGSMLTKYSIFNILTHIKCPISKGKSFLIPIALEC